jgi:hypothetical protein
VVVGNHRSLAAKVGRPAYDGEKRTHLLTVNPVPNLGILAPEEIPSHASPILERPDGGCNCNCTAWFPFTVLPRAPLDLRYNIPKSLSLSLTTVGMTTIKPSNGVRQLHLVYHGHFPGENRDSQLGKPGIC